MVIGGLKVMIKYRVRALIDLSQYGKDASQQLFAGKLTNTVKNGACG